MPDVLKTTAGGFAFGVFTGLMVLALLSPGRPLFSQ
jgi:hypothetical protein